MMGKLGNVYKSQWRVLHRFGTRRIAEHLVIQEKVTYCTLLHVNGDRWVEKEGWGRCWGQRVLNALLPLLPPLLLHCCRLCLQCM